MKTILIVLLAASAAFAQGIGVSLHGADVTQDAAATNGGYIHLAPLTYNPFDGSVCHDNWGNPVFQPMVTGNLSTFGVNDALLWVSLSPSMPFGTAASWSSSTAYAVGQIATVNGVPYAANVSNTNVPPLSSIGVDWSDAFGLVQPMALNVGQGGAPATATGPCGVPLPVNLTYELDLNMGFFARGGLATDQGNYNSIESLQGGVLANSITMGVWYPPGTTVCTAFNGSSCTSTTVLSVGTYLGGHVDTGHSNGPPALGGIGQVSNPFSGAEGYVPGQMYWDDGVGCEEVNSGYLVSTFSCMGGSPGGPSTSVQFNNSGAFGGSSDLVWDNTNAILTVGNIGSSSGIAAPLFNAYGTTGNCWIANGGTAVMNCAGGLNAQAIVLTNGITVGSGGGGSYTWTGAGVLNAAEIDSGGTGAGFFAGDRTSSGYALFFRQGGVAELFDSTYGVVMSWNSSVATFPGGAASPVFNCSATGSSNCLQQVSGTFHVTGAGDSAFQSIAVTNGITVDSGTYGLNGSGVLNVASCTGCGGGSVAGSNTQLQYNSSGAFGASANLTYSGGVLTVGTVGITTPTFNSTATGATAAFQGVGMAIDGTGNGSFYALQVDSGTYGLSHAGVLTIAGGSLSGVAITANSYASALNQSLTTSATPSFGSVTGGVLNCTTTGHSPCVTQASGIFELYGDGDVEAQVVVSTAGFVVPGFTVIDGSANIAGNSVKITGITTNSGGSAVCVTSAGLLYKTSSTC